MSGKTIPYHLRVNKIIERNLFIELLRIIDRYSPINDYTYIGMGGPFMEDFKYIHSSFNLKNMISIEMDENVNRRQSFNLPYSCINHKNNMKIEEYIDTFIFEDPTIIWLDYTEPKELSRHLQELQVLTSKLNSGDILKITLNANAKSLNQNLEERMTKAKDRLTQYSPPDLCDEDLREENYPQTLVNAINIACKAGLAGRTGYVIQPLTAYSYADGQTMTTATAIVLSDAQKINFFDKTKICDWREYSNEWSEVKSIKVPHLSAREKIFIESRLPKLTAEEIISEMGYFIGENFSDAESEMESFTKYYLEYPQFSRVIS